MKKKEMMVIGLLFLVSLLGVFGVKALQSNETSGQKEVLVKHEGVVVKRIPLTSQTNTSYRFEKGEAYNVIEIENGKVHIHEASCRDQICVNHPPIWKNGEVIVCLPNKLVVEVHSETEAVEIDSIVE